MKQSSILSLILVTFGSLLGCQGRSLVDDNPVFTEAPPRRSYTNTSTVAAQSPDAGVIRQVSESSSVPNLQGNTVVAEVNGKPIFVDDLVGSIRVTLDSQPDVPSDQRNQILLEQIKKRIDNYVEQEIVLQALNAAIPADRHAAIEESLEEPFQGVLEDIKKNNQLTTDEDLDKLLATQGMSVDLLRESFFRSQKVQGYLSTLSTTPDVIDRPELLSYYRSHQDEFTSEDRVRWQELVVEFSRHDGEEKAREVMQKAVAELQSGSDFADVAVKYSDALSAEKRGDKGWLQANSLVDTALEKRLFKMKAGQMTEVITRDDRFEIFRVMDREYKTTRKFSDVQSEIERTLKQQKTTDSRKAKLDELKAKSAVKKMLE